jgi:hypothetical protein
MLLRTDMGWLISQVKTNKTAMTGSSFSLINGYDPTANTINYTGERLPSSDSPEFLVLADTLRQSTDHRAPYDVLVHFHHNDTVRSGKHERTTTPDVLEYGRFDSGQDMFDDWKKLDIGINSGMILREHGVVWLGNGAPNFEDYIRRLGITYNKMKTAS